METSAQIKALRNGAWALRYCGTKLRELSPEVDRPLEVTIQIANYLSDSFYLTDWANGLEGIAPSLKLAPGMEDTRD